MINAYFNQAMFFFLGQSKSQFTTLHLIDYAIVLLLEIIYTF